VTRARWIIVAVTAAVLLAGVLAALAYSPDAANGSSDPYPSTYLPTVDSFNGR